LVVNSKALNGLMKADAQLQNESPAAGAMTVPVCRNALLQKLKLDPHEPGMLHVFVPNTLLGYEHSRCRARATFAALLHALAY